VASWITTEDAAGVTIAVQVVPRARRNEIDGVHGDALKVRIAAPPVEGAANEALLTFLAQALGIRKRDISLAAGERGRRKLVRIQGLRADAVAARLLPAASLRARSPTGSQSG